MKKLKLLLLMALLVIPFFGARADSKADLNGTVLTYTVDNSNGGGHFAWYATHTYNNSEADGWGGYENCMAATTLILNCNEGCYLNNDDIVALRKVLTDNTNLVNLNLINAKFKLDLTTGDTPWNYEDGDHSWTGVSWDQTVKGYGSYTNR
jgi:hypothetical protein